MYTFLFYPTFTTQKELYDFVIRTCWYFYPRVDVTGEIVMFYSGADFLDIKLNDALRNLGAIMPAYYDSRIVEIAKEYVGKFQIIPDPSGTILKNWNDPVFMILNWKFERANVFANGSQKLAEKLGAQLLGVDPFFCMRDSMEFTKPSIECVEIEELSNDYENLVNSLTHLKKVVGGRPINLFGTAPSLSNIIESGIDFSQGVSLVCNSMVVNKELMDHLEPKIIICADPIYHGGPSRYAGTFRRDIERTLKERPDLHLIMNYFFYPHFKAVFDPSVHDRIIGLSMDINLREPNLDLLSGTKTVYATENVATMYLLPVACTLSDKINIYCCDGRPHRRNDYFWKTDSKTQYNDLLPEVKLIHPRYYERDFDSYFWDYNQDMDLLLRKAEKLGKTIKTRTPSFNPSLARRYERIV